MRGVGDGHLRQVLRAAWEGSDGEAIARRAATGAVLAAYPLDAIRAAVPGGLSPAARARARAGRRLAPGCTRRNSPFLRTIEKFDFAFQTGLRLQTLGTLLGPELASEHRCALLSSPPGRGKTHLAYRAIQNGFEARFTSADAMIGELSHAARPGRLEEALEPYVHPHVLVIDELGYQSYAADAANVLFRIVNLRYLRRRPIVVTTNKPLAALGRCSMMRTWPRPSSTGSWSAAPTSCSTAAPTAPATIPRR